MATTPETVIGQRLKGVKNIVLVLSGKGGVGKSTFSSQVAFTLAAMNKKVGKLLAPQLRFMLFLIASSALYSGWPR